MKCLHCGKEFELDIKVVEKVERDWRTEPATERQRIALKNFGVLIRPNATRGEASDLLDFHIGEAIKAREG